SLEPVVVCANAVLLAARPMSAASMTIFMVDSSMSDGDEAGLRRMTPAGTSRLDGDPATRFARPSTFDGAYPAKHLRMRVYGAVQVGELTVLFCLHEFAIDLSASFRRNGLAGRRNP